MLLEPRTGGNRSVEDPVVVESRSSDSASDINELETLTSILAMLQKVGAEARARILQSVATFLRINLREPSTGAPQSIAHLSHRSNTPSEPSFSEDRSISPKQFMLEKEPKTDVEKVACLAYYLTHYRSTPHFKTLDISKLNTEAAQVKFSNPAVAVENANRLNYLVPSTKGNKQISALGERFVQALPDREKAKEIMTKARPRKKARKTEDEEEEDQG